MILQIIMSVFGTIAFCVLFGTQAKYYVYCGIVGGFGWFLYMMFTIYVKMPVTAAVCISTLLVIVLARFFAVLEKCPATVFVIAGIFPLIPGAGICWAAYFIVTNQLSEALDCGLTAIKSVIAIVIGIIIAFDFPNRIFQFREYKKQ